MKDSTQKEASASTASASAAEQRASESAHSLVLRAGRRWKESAIQRVLWMAAACSVLTSLAILLILVRESIPFLSEVGFANFFFGTHWAPLMDPRSFGVLPLIAGTLMVTAIAAIFVIPVGSLTAIYLSEYASPRRRAILKPVLEVLAGVPTVVYGYFAISVVTPALRTLLPQTSVFNALSAGLVVGIMVLPMVASLGDDAMRAVPRELREGAYGLGSTAREVSLGVVYPSALSGILASYVLAISRAIGETMIVSMAAGGTPGLGLNPLESVQTMTAYIVQVSLGDTPAGGVEFQTIFAVGLTLFLMTLTMNMFSLWIRSRYREAYA